jgi:hypothetical protein
VDQPAVLAQINDIPATFRPQGNPYAQIAVALASSVALFTNGADATEAQAIAFSNAIDGWIDVYGLLFGVPRNQNEGNIPYALRISETVLAWVGTLPAMQAWISLFAPGGSVAENPSGGYKITLPASLTAAQATAFIESLGRIRPDGVPFTVQQSGTGLFLGTEAFLGAGITLGSYLTGGGGAASPPIGATTPSAQPIIPDLFLVDPNLAQPGLLSMGLQGAWPPGAPPPSP